MGKRKQRKTKEPLEQANKQLNNQENQQFSANYKTPPKGETIVQSNHATHELEKNGGQNSSQMNTNKSKQQQSNNCNTDKRTQQESSKTSAPSYTDQTQLRKQINFSKEKGSPSLLQEQTIQKSNQNPQIGILCQFFVNFNLGISNINKVILSGKQPQKGLNNQQQKICLTQEMDSSLEEVFNIAEDEDYDYEEIGHAGVPLSYQEEHATTATGYGGDYYDEIEYSEDIVNQLIPTKEQNVQQQIGSNNFPRKHHSLQAMARYKYISRSAFQQVHDIKNDEAFQADLSKCLFCIYNNQDIDQYFKQLMNILRVLKEGKEYIQPQTLYEVIVKNIKEFIKGIQMRIIQDMQSIGIIQKVQIQRRFSYDDFFLVDNSFNRNLQQQFGQRQFEFIGSGIHYLIGDQYEKARNIARQNILKEREANKYKIVHFAQGPEAFKRVFDMIIRFYTRVRDSVVNLEEIWVFLMEAVYQQEMKGQLIFEQVHKQLFEVEILQNQYIQEFLNEIKSQYNNSKLNKKQKQNITKSEGILENLYNTLMDLEEEINFQYQDVVDQECIRKGSQETNDQTGNTLSQDLVETEEQQNQDDGSSIIITYEQLKEKTRERQGGLTLSEYVQHYEKNFTSDKNILKQIQQDRRSQEMMNNLNKFDTDTICYIINNKISPKDCEQILMQNKQKLGNNEELIKDQEIESDDDDLIISPPKGFVKNGSQHMNNDQFNLSSNEDDKQVEKKKKKNLKKKKKRKEKKIQAQQQLQLDQLWYQKLQEELDQRDLRKKIIEYLQNATEEEQNQMISYLRENKLPKASSSYPNNGEGLQRDQLLQAIEAEWDSLEQDEMILEIDEQQTNCESDKEFESQLQQFRDRLEIISKEGTTKRRKLVPNVCSNWLNQLRQTLSKQYSLCSPKGTTTSCIMQHDHKKGDCSLWLNKQQNSA